MPCANYSREQSFSKEKQKTRRPYFEFGGLALVISGTGCFGSTVHNTPRSASSASLCKRAALALSGSARASRRYLTARSWFLLLMLEVFTSKGLRRNQKPLLSLMPAVRV